MGALAGSFNEMAGRVASREGELRQLNLDLEHRVSARTAELAETTTQLREEIVERHRAEETLQQSLTREKELNEMKSNFVSLVSHEFRTPLGVIMSAADVLARYFERLTPEKRARIWR